MPWSELGMGSPLTIPLVKGHLSCPLRVCDQNSMLPSLSSRNRGVMVPQSSHNGSLGVGNISFQGLSPKRKGRGLPTTQCGASQSWLCLFLWAKDQASVPQETC